MGLVNPAVIPIAESISSAELRKALFFRHASRGNPRVEALLRELAAEAGGLDQAFAAAFGPQAGRFFSKVSSSRPLGRRTFLKETLDKRGLSDRRAHWQSFGRDLPLRSSRSVFGGHV